ncbi:cell surface protein, partial [[Clostridium] symbiosum]|nr:cell surface protein [[Clostridium] symbiosum]
KMKKLRLFPGAALCLALTLGMTVPAMADSGSWQQDNDGRWKYITESGTVAAPGWLEADGNWYRIGEDGNSQTGWFREDDAWYYLDESGIMATGWKKVDGKH